MRRREFISLIGGVAVTWPLAVQAQQPAVPVIGFLSTGSAKGRASYLAAFHEGLRKGGFVEGENVAIEYRWAEDHYVPTGSVKACDETVTGVANLSIQMTFNPANPTVAETQSREARLAAHTLGVDLHVLNASTERDFDAVFANLIRLRADGL